MKISTAFLFGALEVAGVWSACAAAEVPFVISPETASALRACMAVDDSQRLACYDRALNRTNSARTADNARTEDLDCPPGRWSSGRTSTRPRS